MDARVALGATGHRQVFSRVNDFGLMGLLAGYDALPLMLFLGFFVWTFSTATGGGGPLLFLPAVSFVAPIREVSPITCITAGLVSVHRIFLFRRFIQWRILAWLLPGSIVGATVGVHIFALVNDLWLLLLLGLFLTYNGLISFFHRQYMNIRVRTWHYTLAGVVFGGLSAVVGAAGQGINVLFLNDQVTKERLIATKAVEATTVQAIKLIGYLYLAQIGSHVLLLGGVAAVGAMAGNLVGRRLLMRLSDGHFRFIANGLILAAGILLLLKFLTTDSL